MSRWCETFFRRLEVRSVLQKKGRSSSTVRCEPCAQLEGNHKHEVGAAVWPGSRSSIERDVFHCLGPALLNFHIRLKLKATLINITNYTSYLRKNPEIQEVLTYCQMMVANDIVVALGNQHISPRQDKNQGSSSTEVTLYLEKYGSGFSCIWCFDVNFLNGMKIYQQGIVLKGKFVCPQNRCQGKFQKLKIREKKMNAKKKKRWR